MIVTMLCYYKSSSLDQYWYKTDILFRLLPTVQQLVPQMVLICYTIILNLYHRRTKLQRIYSVCDKLKSQPSVSGHQADIEEEGGCVSHAGLHIAESSYIGILVLFQLSITIFICIEYREKLVDLSFHLCYDMALSGPHAHNPSVSFYKLD